MSVTRDRAETALTFLSETDREIADARANLSRAEYVLKRIEANAYLTHTEGTVKDREARARTSPEYVEAYERVTKYLGEYEYLRAKRETERIAWETWRTVEASRRAGS